ncbi:MAG: hypothetical protein MJ197_00290 [Bacteroidales bacterium]|nr:hypothetical protein [Bacteroidales bacterium]
MKKFILYILFCLLSSVTFAQRERDTTSRINWEQTSWDETMNLFYEPGYLTAGGGLGNIEPLLFEGNIVPYYRIGLDAIKHWAFIISPQVIVRMYNDYSYPVRTPSYEPRIILVHQTLTEKHPAFSGWFQYASLYHHSNGQDGYFYTDSTNTTINTHDGSFSTNWIEAGTFYARTHSTRQYYAKLYGKYCYQLDTMLNGLYGRWRFNFDLKFEWNIAKTIYNLFNIQYFKNKESIFSNVLKFGVIAGNMAKRDALDIHRCVLDYTISFKPAFLQDVTIFAQYYWGEDYYNIYFNRTLRLFRVGLTAHSEFFSRKTIF